MKTGIKVDEYGTMTIDIPESAWDAFLDPYEAGEPVGKDGNPHRQMMIPVTMLGQSFWLQAKPFVEFGEGMYGVVDEDGEWNERFDSSVEYIAWSGDEMGPSQPVRIFGRLYIVVMVPTSLHKIPE